MPTYRAPRPGDLITVRTSDPHLDEVQVVIDSVADNGDFMFISGAWKNHDLEVVIRRVGQPTLHPQEN